MSEGWQEFSLDQFECDQDKTVSPLPVLPHQRAQLASEKSPEVQIPAREEEAIPAQLRPGGVERGGIQRGRVLRSLWHPGRSERTRALHQGKILTFSLSLLSPSLV